MEYIQDNNNVFVRLDKGEELFDALLSIAELEKWQTGFISGIGGIIDAELGMFNVKTQKYERKNFGEVCELLSLQGNLSMHDSKPFIHLHAIISDESYQCFGGHLFSAKIAVTAEINIRLFNQVAKRRFNEEIGINEISFCP